MPLPVGPVTTTRPSFRWQSFLIASGSLSSSKDRILAGIWRKTAAWPQWLYRKLPRNRAKPAISWVQVQAFLSRGTPIPASSRGRSPSGASQGGVHEHPCPAIGCDRAGDAGLRGTAGPPSGAGRSRPLSTIDLEAPCRSRPWAQGWIFTRSARLEMFRERRSPWRSSCPATGRRRRCPCEADPLAGLRSPSCLRRPVVLPSRTRFAMATLLTRISHAMTRPARLEAGGKEALADDPAQSSRRRSRGSGSAAAAGNTGSRSRFSRWSSRASLVVCMVPITRWPVLRLRSPRPSRSSPGRAARRSR